MPMKRVRMKSISLAILSLSVVATPAAAQSALERFFFGERLRYAEPRYPAPPARRYPAPPSEAARPPAPPKIAKVSGPTYYNYKTDALKVVRFAGLTQTAVSDDAPALNQSAFLDDLAGVEILAEPEIGEALRKFYAETGEPIWIEHGKPNERAIQAIRAMGEADRFGLDPADYSISLPAGSQADAGSAGEEAARFEALLSARVLRYVSDARNGRIVADRLSGYHDLPRKEIDLPAVLKSLAHMSDVRTYLESRHPQNEAYQALRRELELLRAAPEDKSIEIDRTAVIKPGQSHPDFPVVLGLIAGKGDAAFREEFGDLLQAYRDSADYAPELAPAIKAAQRSLGLAADGVIGPRTLAVLAGEPRSAKLEKVLLSLERLRWLPSEFGERHVFINAASFRVTYHEEGRERLNMRAVVGSKANQTYFFTDKIQQVDFNPYWGVPQSIIVNEMLPKLYRDPSYLDRAGYEVFSRNGQRVSSASVNWWQYNGKVPFDVRQKPGPKNALGELKILFPNSHAIYMHDTPEKSLFSRDTRAFSHGCVRLEDPRAMAAAVLGWSVDEVAARIQRGHSSEKVTGDIPVYIAYFTAWPEDGKIGYHGDSYDRDAHLLKAMKLTSETRQAGS